MVHLLTRTMNQEPASSGSRWKDPGSTTQQRFVDLSNDVNNHKPRVGEIEAASTDPLSVTVKGKRGRQKIVKAIVSDAHNAKTWAALEKAASSRSSEKVRLLLAHGADPEATLQDNRGNPTKDTVLLSACRGYRPSLEVVEILLEHGANVNAIGDEGGTPLMAACAQAHVDIVRRLVQNGAQVNARSDQLRTPLILSCKSYQCPIEIVQLLLDKGADANAADGECFTALMGACCNGHLEAAKLLLEHGADVDARDHDNCTPLFGVCQGPRHSTEFMKLLLEKGASPNTKRGCGCTAFSAITGMGTMEQIQLLLDHGADVNAGCQRHGKPLQSAIRNRDWQVADLLLERGADPDRCMILAIQAQAELQLLDKLLEKGASIDQANNQSDTALSVSAVYRKDVALVHFLLERGAVVNVRGDTNGQHSSTPWLKLVSDKEASLEMVRLFLDKGALVNDRDPQGNTPLMLAKALPVVKLLLEQLSIEVNAINEKGDTALIHHTRHDSTIGNTDYPSTEIIQELLKHENVNKKTNNAQGETALMVAVEQRRVDVVQLLLEADDDVAVNQVDSEGKTALHKAVLGSTSLVPIVPPNILVGSMAMTNNGRSLSIEGTWGIDEASSMRETSQNRFWFRRVLKNGEPMELGQLEQLGGTFNSTFNMTFQRGGSEHCGDGNIELSFSRRATLGEGAADPVMYNVQGSGPGNLYGVVSVEGTVTLQTGDADGTRSANVKLIKTYHPGTGWNSCGLNSFCDNIVRAMGEKSGSDDGKDKPEHSMAVHKDYLMMVHLLLQHGTDVNMKDASREGNSPLMIACRDHGDALDMAQLLVSRGASVDAQNNDGKTALILATEQDSLSMVYFLLRKGGALTALKRDP